jgi:hypothetical protein
MSHMQPAFHPHPKCACYVSTFEYAAMQHVVRVETYDGALDMVTVSADDWFVSYHVADQELHVANMDVNTLMCARYMDVVRPFINADRDDVTVVRVDIDETNTWSVTELGPMSSVFIYRF